MRWMLLLLSSGLILGACSSSPISRKIGAQCTERDDCDERCLRGDDYPDGLCTIACNDSGDCPADADCVDVEGGVCLFSCSEPQDCAELLGIGWDCNSKDLLNGGDQEVLVCIAD